MSPFPGAVCCERSHLLDRRQRSGAKELVFGLQQHLRHECGPRTSKPPPAHVCVMPHCQPARAEARRSMPQGAPYAALSGHRVACAGTAWCSLRRRQASGLRPGSPPVPARGAPACAAAARVSPCTQQASTQRAQRSAHQHEADRCAHRIRGRQIKVKTLTGKEIEIDIESDDSISRIKERVEEKEGIPPPQQLCAAPAARRRACAGHRRENRQGGIR